MTNASSRPQATIDEMDDPAALHFILDIQLKAVSALASCLPEISEAAARVAHCIRGGGRLIYCGAGSSGLIALQDAAELPGTFGLDPRRILFLMAGGLHQAQDLKGHVEDDEEQAKQDLDRLEPQAPDLMIALSASGSTPYTLAAARHAKDKGVQVIGIANKANTPLLSLSDVGIGIITPPEAVTGSSRMAAGTAQKCALGLISTLANTRLGHVFRGEMVNLRADNLKLRRRSIEILTRITGVSEETASEALRLCSNQIKDAILLIEGARSPEEARSLLERTEGDLSPALRRLKSEPKL